MLPSRCSYGKLLSTRKPLQLGCLQARKWINLPLILAYGVLDLFGR